MINKRLVGCIFIIFLVAVFCIFAGASTFYTVKTIFDTPLYEQPSHDSEKVLDVISGNETVELVGEVELEADGKSWIKVRYGAYEGYVRYDFLYKRAGQEEYDVQVVRATGKSSGDKIYLYTYHDVTSEIAHTIYDGEKLNLIVEQDESYGEFRKVIYDGEFYFIKSDNITTGLTYSHKLAIIIAAGITLVIIVIGVIIGIIHRKNKGVVKNK